VRFSYLQDINTRSISRFVDMIVSYRQTAILHRVYDLHEYDSRRKPEE